MWAADTIESLQAELAQEKNTKHGLLKAVDRLSEELDMSAKYDLLKRFRRAEAQLEKVRETVAHQARNVRNYSDPNDVFKAVRTKGVSGMSDFRVIGIHGLARTGKDTVANRLVSEHGFVRVGFADPLKAMVCALLNVDEDWIEEHKEADIEGIASPRRLLQTLGTEWGRNIINQNIWVNAAFRKIADVRNDKNVAGVVIPDVRFNNEARAIREYDGCVWEISRKDAPPVAKHASEGGVRLEYITATIKNDDTLEDLWTITDYLINEDISQW
jgi:hypothetical protein